MLMFGEPEKVFVTVLLKTAKACGGRFISFSPTGVQTIAYGGNVAWAFILASKVLKKDAKIAGEAFFIPDETPQTQLTDFARPFLEERGFSMSRICVPFWIMYCMVCLLQLLCLLLQPIVRLKGPRSMTRSSLKLMYRNMTFSGQKAKTMLGYKPLYSFEESLKRSLKFYKEVPLY